MTKWIQVEMMRNVMQHDARIKLERGETQRKRGERRRKRGERRRKRRNIGRKY